MRSNSDVMTKSMQNLVPHSLSGQHPASFTALQLPFMLNGSRTIFQ